MCSSLEALGENLFSCPFKIVGRIQTLFICAVPDVYRMTLWKPLPSFVFLFPLPFISDYPYRNRMTYFLLYSFNKIMHVQNWAGLWGSLPHTPFHGGELVGFGWRNSPAVAWLFVGKLGLASRPPHISTWNRFTQQNTILSKSNKTLSLNQVCFVKYESWFFSLTYLIFW